MATEYLGDLWMATQYPGELIDDFAAAKLKRFPGRQYFKWRMVHEQQDPGLVCCFEQLQRGFRVDQMVFERTVQRMPDSQAGEMKHNITTLHCCKNSIGISDITLENL